MHHLKIYLILFSDQSLIVYFVDMHFYFQASHSLYQCFLLPSVLVSIGFCLYVTNTNILTFGIFIMVVISLSFFHLSNMHSYTELICLHPPIMQNLQATILLEFAYYKKNSKQCYRSFFFSIHEEYIIIIHIITLTCYPLDGTEL